MSEATHAPPGSGGQQSGMKDKASEVTGQAQEKAQQMAGQAQEKAQQAAGQARGRLREQVDQRSSQAGERVRSTAHDMRSVAQQLREQGSDQPARLADQAADRADRLGGYLEESDADRILDDVEDFARRRPMAIALGGLALGFAAARMLKASSSERYQASSQQRQIPRETSGRFESPGVPAPAGRPVVP